MHPKIEFRTHPNAPVVVNRYVQRGKRRYYNRSRWGAKYSPADSAQWLCDTMNKSADSGTVWYIVGTN